MQGLYGGLSVNAEVLFSSVKYDKYDADATLPAKFGRLVDRMGMQDIVKDAWTVIKMHLGRYMVYSTIPPLFVKILVDKLKSYGGRVYIADNLVDDAKSRGYTEDYLGVPIVPVCGITGKYFYEKAVDFRSFENVDVGGNIHDAEVLIDLSHVKGHGACGYAGACKNIAMGCVTDRTRSQIHELEGGIAWDEQKCLFCDLCIKSCNHHANSFVDGKYSVFFHHCTFCQHCVKVCPSGALYMTEDRFEDFQTGMALCAKTVLDCFKPEHVFYINFLLNITALCDCWGFTTPAIVPDIGVMASKDIVAIEKASLDAIKFEDLIPAGIPEGHELGDHGHLLQRLHYKDPFIQLRQLEKLGLGTQDYDLNEIR
jgi:uncharacterized Fe-S center protein